MTSWAAEAVQPQWHIWPRSGASLADARRMRSWKKPTCNISGRVYRLSVPELPVPWVRLNFGPPLQVLCQFRNLQLLWLLAC